MPVTIEMKTFSVLNADEDNWLSDGDEPYLLPLNIFADGRTIDIARINDARVRIFSPRRTHENLARGHLKAGRTIAVPEETGLLETTMRPFSGLGTRLGKDMALAALAVIVMEEDTTPTTAIEAGRRTLIRETRSELETLVQSLQSPSEENIAALTARVQSKVVDTMKRETLSSVADIFSVVDPDDFIDSGFMQHSYREIQDAGAEGIPFDLRFAKSGVSYALAGLIKNI